MPNLERYNIPIEGDYLETHEGLLFTIKGLRHPEGLIIAYLRYIPDANGTRFRDGKLYTRVYSIKNTTNYLSEHYPQYLNYVKSMDNIFQSIPQENIKRIYKAQEYLQNIIKSPNTTLEKISIQFVNEIAKRSNVSLSHFGVSGSSLIGLDTPSSDIDLIVYGETEGKAVYKVLDKMREDLDWISPYNSKTITPILQSRWVGTGLNINYFREIEVKKLLHGQIFDKDYFIRILKPYESNEKSRPVKFVKIRGFIEENEPLFTPCYYRFRLKEYIEPMNGPEITELVSFRGKFTEQAETGSYVEVFGMLEEVISEGTIHHRLILGSSRDYLLPVSFLDR